MRELAAQQLFRVPPCHEDTIHIHLQTSMSSPRFNPSPYSTAVSVTNHYTGWASNPTTINVTWKKYRIFSKINRGDVIVT
ncbi:hypothetical protein TNCV_2379891 [Trichonephila clavipes]|uniref:Uncharacterized protein n=1 Tax=Trichonephila clavipes TaxID=2585209 RepID=A0A8X6RGN0_TRICX|nr:hypothetical protein TNCV_2379891 [Trichonephila clavipes]